MIPLQPSDIHAPHPSIFVSLAVLPRAQLKSGICAKNSRANFSLCILYLWLEAFVCEWEYYYASGQFDTPTATYIHTRTGQLA
jgi:hypothetical protein